MGTAKLFEQNLEAFEDHFTSINEVASRLEAEPFSAEDMSLLRNEVRALATRASYLFRVVQDYQEEAQEEVRRCREEKERVKKSIVGYKEECKNYEQMAKSSRKDYEGQREALVQAQKELIRYKERNAEANREYDYLRKKAIELHDGKVDPLIFETAVEDLKSEIVSVIKSGSVLHKLNEGSFKKIEERISRVEALVIVIDKGLCRMQDRLTNKPTKKKKKKKKSSPKTNTKSS